VSLELLHPFFLLLLLLLPLVWFRSRAPALSPALLLRVLVFALVVLALAQPVIVVPDDREYQVVVVDRSASVGAAGHARADRLLREWRQRVVSPERAALVVLGENELTGIDGIPTVRLAGTASTSPLGSALDAALRQIPQGATGAVTLMTDGLGTDRRWGATMREFVERGVPIKVIDLSAADSEARVVDIVAPAQMHAGQTAELSVEVAGTAPQLVARLRDEADRELARSAVFACQGSVSVPLQFEPAKAGVLDFTIDLIVPGAAEPLSPRQSKSTSLAVQAPLRLLYLGGRVDGGAAALRELLGNAFKVTDGAHLELGASTPLRDFDLVMVDDRPAAELPAAFQERLAEAVRSDGLGILYTGGRAAFGAGGYDDTPVADLLPVDIIQRAEKQDPSTALALIIDTSGSMRGERIELAKQIARLAIRRLKAHDRVGIVEFYGNKHWALPLQSAANKIAVERAIGRMQATGGTILYPAIEEAYFGLKNVSTRFKHILIITDAGLEDADYGSLVRKVANDNVTLSTVLVGAQSHSKSLLDMANWGNGRFYGASDRYALPEILLKQATTTNLPAYRNGTFPVSSRGGMTWWEDLDTAALPPLAGYVETQLRSGAEALLDVEGAGHPVVASWQSGAGRVTAMMTEPLGDGSRPWREWKAYGRWLARIAARTAGDQSPFRFEIVRRDHEVTVSARRTASDRDLAPVAQLVGATTGEARPIEFFRLSPDRYEARFRHSPATAVEIKAYAVDATGRISGSETLLAAAPFSDVAPELQVNPADRLDLARLALMTNGTLQSDADAGLGELPRPPTGTGVRVLDVWAYAALLALLAYLAEIAVRRWPATSSSPVAAHSRS
jgi:Ca-activated chloride channel homolog